MGIFSIFGANKFLDTVILFENNYTVVSSTTNRSRHDGGYDLSWRRLLCSCFRTPCKRFHHIIRPLALTPAIMPRPPGKAFFFLPVAAALFYWCVAALFFLPVAEGLFLKTALAARRADTSAVRRQLTRTDPDTAVPCSCSYCKQGETLACLNVKKKNEIRTCVNRYEDSRVCKLPPGDVVLRDAADPEQFRDPETSSPLSLFCLYECTPQSVEREQGEDSCDPVSHKRVMQLAAAQLGDRSFDIDVCLGDRFTHPLGE